MNIIPTNSSTPITPAHQSANTEGLAIDDVPLSEALRSDSKLKLDEQVTLSEKSLFLFKLNTYANTLTDQERNKFADALEASGDPIFSQGFLDSIRCTMSHGGITVEKSAIMDGPMRDNQFGVIAEYGGSIPYNGMMTNYLDDYAAAGKDKFTNELEEIFASSHDDLTRQDRASIASAFDRAIFNSFNALKSDFDIFSANYQFLIAQDAIDGFALSEETSSKLSSLLNDIKENNLQVNSDKLAQDIRDADKFPNHASTILASAEKTREGIALSNLLQNQMGESGASLLELEDYFSTLMKGSSSIDLLSEPDYGGLFDYYKAQEDSFKRSFIEQNYILEGSQNADTGPEGQLGEPESTISAIASSYIDAVNAYLSTQGSSNHSQANEDSHHAAKGALHIQEGPS